MQTGERLSKGPVSFDNIRQEMIQIEESLRQKWSSGKLWELLNYQKNQTQDIKMSEQLTLIDLFVSSLATTWWRGHDSLGIEQGYPVYFSRASFERDSQAKQWNGNQNLTRDKCIKYYFMLTLVFHNIFCSNSHDWRFLCSIFLFLNPLYCPISINKFWDIKFQNLKNTLKQLIIIKPWLDLWEYKCYWQSY